MHPHRHHFAQYYDTQEFLIASLKEFVKIGMEHKEGVLIIGTECTWKALLLELNQEKIDSSALIAAESLIFLSANSIAKDVLDPKISVSDIFRHGVDPLVCGQQIKFGGVRIYCEVVDVLSRGGSTSEAVQLEAAWNAYLSELESVTLMCGYSYKAIAGTAAEAHLLSIENAHTLIIPREDVDTAVADIRLIKRLGALAQRSMALDLERSESRIREAHLEDVLRGLTNIDKFSSLNQICLLLAHQIKNPLQVIKSSSEQLELGCKEKVPPTNEVVAKRAARINEATQTIVTLLQNVIATTKSSDN